MKMEFLHEGLAHDPPEDLSVSAKMDEIVARLQAHPEFLEAIQAYYQAKYAFNSGFALVMRLMGNREKSMVSGIVFAMWLEATTSGRRQDCTVSAIAERASRYGLMSPNTVKGMIAEFETYGLLERKAEPGNRKNKVVEVAPYVPAGVSKVHELSLNLLDRLLPGSRLERHQQQPEAFFRAHPEVIHALATDAANRRAPAEATLFYDVKFGSWIAEDLIMKVRSAERDGQFFVIDEFNRTAIGTKFMLSRSSAQRLFLAAEKAGMMKQVGRTLLISDAFVRQFTAFSAREIAAFEVGWNASRAAGPA
ncbi:hypothetical protein [Rhizobium sp. C4]|uniref:hypothetical protein n=1 Tax=Rhizobium sp. C4 TaxID=1349800 RepID=UPI001E2BA046|nr:hypothetical protein [Rhizobium sp. C4]MCD2175784.1 hypothetical protein [Rhizobium sp. C4]